MNITCGSKIKIEDLHFESKQSGCCGQMPASKRLPSDKASKADWIAEYRDTKIGKIPVISTRLTVKDIVGGWKVRWGINRMSYRISPGLYSIGNPDETSLVFVTANYKLTFDKVRKEFSGINGWLLILDTKGVNVWCAAGKGTFGTEELINRISITGLSSLVSHRTLILPQLGAVGVTAYEITKATGFKVVYGPVWARDIKKFLENNFEKTEKMRTVDFPLADRMAVSAIAIVHSWKILLILFLVSGVFSFLQNKGLTFAVISDFLPYLGAVFTGAVVFSALLPYLLFRSFALKGYLLGILFTLTVAGEWGCGLWDAAVYFLVIPPVVSYISLNFTGASTFTSLTGTKKEVSASLPLYAVSIAAGTVVKILIVLNCLS